MFLPGGKIENGESKEACIVRDMFHPHHAWAVQLIKERLAEETVEMRRKK